MPYFTAHESKAERRRKPEVAVRNFHSATKANLVSRTPAGGALLDLGCGRGADVARYRHFTTVVAVDQDSDALEELRRRSAGQSISVQTFHADFRQPLPPLGRFHMTSAFFCCHYAVPDLDTFARNVAANLEEWGLFVGVDLDGAAALQLLQKEPGRQKEFGAGWVRLALVPGDRDLSVTIKSISPQPKLEPLLFWPLFSASMTRRGLHLLDTGMLRPGAAIDDPELSQYSSLHRWWVFRKMKPTFG